MEIQHLKWRVNKTDTKMESKSKPEGSNLIIGLKLNQRKKSDYPELHIFLTGFQIKCLDLSLDIYDGVEFPVTELYSFVVYELL